MNGNYDSLRSQLVNSSSAIHLFHEFVYQKELTVLDVFDDSVLGERARRASTVFDIISGLSEYIVKKDNHASAHLDKLIVELSCFYEWTFRLFLHIFSRLTPYRENETARLFIEKIGTFLNQVRNNDEELFNYFIREIKDLVSHLCLFYDQGRIGVKYDVHHFETKKLDLITAKRRANEDYFEPEYDIDFSLMTVHQVESLFICCIEILISTGKAFIVPIGLRAACEMMSYLVSNCISFASPKMLLASIKLFHRFYPVKCIGLNPAVGFYYHTCWLTVSLLKSTSLHKDFCLLTEKSWNLIAKRLDLELELARKKEDKIDVVKNLNAIIIVTASLSKVNPVSASNLVNDSLAKILHKLIDLYDYKNIAISKESAWELHKTFCDKLASSVSHDSVWLPFMKRLYVKNYLEVYEPSNQSTDNANGLLDCSLNSSGLPRRKTIFDDFCRATNQILTSFLASQSLDDIVTIHNMYHVEWETIASLRIVGHCPLNQGNFVQIKEAANWICDHTLANIVDESLFKFVLSLLIIVLKAIKEFSLSDDDYLSEKIGLVFLLPHVSQTSPAEILSSINHDWMMNEFSINDELNILSLYGLALVKICNKTKLAFMILISQLCRWKGDDYSFNQTLTLTLLKNEQMISKTFNAIEYDENMPFTARSIGLITCFLSSADKGVLFSCRRPYERCGLVFLCNGCSDWDSSHQKSSLSEDAECKVMEIFHKIIQTKDVNLLTSLGKWSVSRVLRHCGIDRSLLASLFKLFSIEAEEVVDVLNSIFFPLIIEPIKSGSLKVPKKDLLFRAFNKVFSANREESNLTVQITEINNITNFSNHLDESDLHHILIIFFRKVWSDSDLREHVQQKMILIASFRGYDLRSLFNRHKINICTRLINIVMDDIVPKDASRGWFSLREALSLFTTSQDESALNSLFTESLLQFFCAMVQKANVHALSLSENFFQHTDLTATFLTQQYSYGLPHQFVALTSLEAVERSLSFVKRINSDKSLSSIFSAEFKNSLLIVYHRNPKIAAYALYKIYISEDVPVNHPSFQDSKFISMLEAQMGSFFIAVNRFLLKPGDSLEDKRLAVESLGDFLQLLGSSKVPIFKMNIMGILLTAFNKANKEATFLKTLLQIWDQFLGYCAPSDIGPHLSVICKDLIPYFEVDSEGTASILKKLIVTNQRDFKDRFRELHFLPDVGCMKEVQAVLSRFVKIQNPEETNQSTAYLLENIRYFDQLLDIYNPDVKALHCERLRKILSACKTPLAYLCLPSKEASTDIMITLIIRKLLINSQISDENLLIRIAECLGEIGAIDPGRLDLSLLSANQNVDGAFIEFDDLPVTILSKLANTLDSIDQSRIRDCVCYSIQETLKSYNVRENDDIWVRLPTEVQRNIKQFFTTRYVFREGNDVHGHPVFHPDITYEEWAYKWSVVLIEKIDKFAHRKAFEACLAIIKYNSTIARFLLPTIFWMALLDLNESGIKSYIVGEINTIIETRPSEGQDNLTLVSDSLNPMSSPPRIHSSQNRSEFAKVRLRCARTFFTILDSIAQLKSRLFSNARKISKEELEVKAQIELLEKNLDKPELAELAFECQAFARALLYTEECVGNNRETLAVKLTFFQKYFLSLDEPDGVEGISAIREGPASLMDKIINHEANSELHFSLACCEVAMKKEPNDLIYPKNLLRCLMNLDQYATAFNYATGVVQRKRKWQSTVYPTMVEASWKLRRWDDLDDLLRENATLESDALGVNIGHLIDYIQKKDVNSFSKMLREIRKREMDPLSGSASEQGAYIRGYQHILRLHMLTDIEKFSNFVFAHLNTSEQRSTDDQIKSDFENLIRDWESRNDLVQSSLRYQEQVFNLQRALLSLNDILPIQTVLERAKFSLTSAKLARKGQNLQRAYTNLVEIQDLINTGNVPVSLAMHSEIETAKFHWTKGDQESKERGYKGLKRALEKYEGMKDGHGIDPLKLLKIKLLYAKFSEHLSNLDSESLKTKYKEITTDIKQLNAPFESEEPYFCFARYLDRLLKEKDLKDQCRPQLMYKVATTYAQSLRYGAKHVYESMSRILSIWCDLGSSAAEYSKGRSSKALEQAYSKSCDDLTDLMNRIKEILPLHLFYTAFSQLLSRICHSNTNISETLMSIIAKLIEQYPNQSMWMLIGVQMNRENKTRAEKCVQILEKVKAKGDQRLTKFLKDMQIFATQLIKLCKYNLANQRSFHINKAVPDLNLFLKKNAPSKIMLPYQAFMSVRMRNKLESSNTFRPFPSDVVYISSFDDVGEVLPSQAKPKKVVINCTDGKKYSVMCKPKDDLRKDARTMEFNNLINRLLKRDPETRKRRLHIRTYTVVPLDNDCGLIEWVSNLQSLRDSIDTAQIFRSGSPYPKVTELAKIMTGEITKKGSAEEAKEVFGKVMQVFVPPVLGEWFVYTFPDPTSWYMARLAFTRSAAVMSVVGYIIGLGDRHAENILLDTSNGEAMHVDFNLLFNQGDYLEFPEKVPFRLTHNMIAAMGVTGSEGSFRRTCEVTLRLMREKKAALMSVLQPFVYDPLCEWKPRPRGRASTARSGSSADKETVEVTNTKALEFLGKIENRLNGNIKKATIPISVSGQVQYLIDEATSLDNLCRMYIGWSAFY